MAVTINGSTGITTNGITDTTGTDALNNVTVAGTLGVGTVSPTAKLNITGAGDATFSSQLIIAPASGANPAKIAFNPTVSSAIAGLSDGSVAFYGNGANTERMRIDSSGIVTGTAGNLMLVNLAKVNLSTIATVLSTAIPSWAKKITLAINGLSSNGTADYQVQIGYVGQAAGTYVTTGYTSFSNVVASTGGATTSTSGFVIRNNEGAAQTSYGHMTLTLQDSATNTWVSSHSMGCTNGAGKYELIGGGGVVALSAALDRIQITAGGTDLLDAGSINIQYE